MSSDKQIVAQFSKLTYTVQIESNPSDGGTVRPDSGTYEAGNMLTLTATPATGYRFVQWGTDASGSTNPLSILVDNNKVITANFVRQYTLVVSANPTSGGTFSPNTGLYDANSIVNLTATPSFPYDFVNWVGTDNNNMNPTSVTMNTDKSVIANFTQLSPGPAQTASGIYTGREIRLAITLQAGQWVKGGFISDSLTNVPLRILNPAFGVVQDLGYTLNTSFTFQAQATGDYYVDIPYTFAFATSNYTITYTIYS